MTSLIYTLSMAVGLVAGGVGLVTGARIIKLQNARKPVTETALWLLTASGAIFAICAWTVEAYNRGWVSGWASH